MSKTHMPGANRTTQYWAGKFVGSKMNTNCVCLHTTETGNAWPGYGGGASAPHMTVQPNIKARTVTIRQHFPADRSSRALVNLAGGVETNTLNVFQIELIGTCDSKYRKSRREWGTAGVDYIYWPDAPDWLLEAIAPIFRWLDAEWENFKVADATPRGWVEYPSSYGLRARQRMTFAEWRNAYGIFGHQHVPENTHGDPGNFPIARLIQAVKGGATPAPEPSTPTPPTSGKYTVRRGDTLSAIAKTYGVTVANLAAWNSLKDPNRLDVGQELRLTKPTTVAPPAKPKSQDVRVMVVNAASRNPDVIKAMGPWKGDRVDDLAAYILKHKPDFIGAVELYAADRPLLDKQILGTEPGTYARIGVKGGRVAYLLRGSGVVVGGSVWTDLLPGAGTKYALARKIRFSQGAVGNFSVGHLSYETSADGVRKRAKEAPAWIAWVRKLFPTDYDLFVGDVNSPAGATTRADDVGPIFARYNLRDLRHDTKVQVGKGRYHLIRLFGGLVKAKSITTEQVGFSDHPIVHATVTIPID